MSAHELSASESTTFTLLERIAIAVEALVAARTEQREPAPDVLTATDFAALLQVDVRTLRTMRNAGEVPSGFMVGSSPRWKRSQIDAWIESQSSGKSGKGK